MGWIIDQLSLIALSRGQEVLPERLRINAEDLADLSREQLTVAFNKVRRECDYYPSVAEVRRLAGAGDEEGTVDAEARAAWEMLELFVRKYVDCDVFGNYGPEHGWHPKSYPLLSERIMGAVKRTGGWAVYKKLTDKDFPFQQKRFFDEYKAFALAEPIAAPGRLLVMPRPEEKALPVQEPTPEQQVPADPAEIASMLSEIARMPEPEYIRKMRHFEEKPRYVTPAVHMTPEQIMERVKQERANPNHRAEIERYKKQVQIEKG